MNCWWFGTKSLSTWIRDGGFGAEIRYRMSEIMPETLEQSKPCFVRHPTNPLSRRLAAGACFFEEDDPSLRFCDNLSYVVPQSSTSRRRLAAHTFFLVDESRFLRCGHNLLYLVPSTYISTIPYHHTIPYGTCMVWWYGMMWYSMVWRGMVCGAV